MSDTGGAPMDSDEQHRLAVLQGLDLLDAPVDPAFEAVVRAARQSTGCAASAITLVTETHVHALASVGLPKSVVLRERALCPRALAAGGGFFEMADTERDARFAALPQSAARQRVRSYAGVPLWVSGVALGTLCVMHDQPRELSAAEREQLEDLAAVATALLRQHQARQSLGLQIERLMDLTRASGDWMWETDEQGRYRWISGDFERLTGLSPSACIGRTLAAEPLVDGAGELLPGDTSLLDHLLQREPFTRVASRMTTPRGTIYVSRSAQPVFDGQGGFCGFRGTARDVTARKQAQHAQREHEALRRQVEVAERASRDKGEFLSRVSHELRTPLNAILGFAQLMALDHEPGLSEPQQGRLDGVRQAGETLLQLIDELLEVSCAGPRATELAAGAGVAGVEPARDAGRPAAAGPQEGAPAPSAQPVPAPTEPPPPPAPRSRVVLYIEDEPLNIVLMQEIFRAQPAWTLHVARDGSEGVEMAAELRPDLALIDMNLPDFNGIEVLRRLRATPSLLGLRCIALSADAMAEQIAAARAAGFDDYWTKPIDLTRLLAAVAKVLDGP